MREIWYKGQIAKITEKDYRRLLERFDTTRAVKTGKEWKIDIACPFCVRYLNSNCKGCPLSTFHSFGSSLGCSQLLDEAVGCISYVLYVAPYDIFWDDCDAEEARSDLDEVYRKLLALPKV